MSEEKYIGKAKMKAQPSKPLLFKLKEKSVFLKHLAADVMAKIYKIDDLQNQVDSLEIHGMAVSNEFGDDPHIGISQKKLTEANTSLNNKVDTLDAESDIDTASNRYLLFKDDKRYFIPMTELVKPLAPTIAVTQYAVITGNFNVQVTNRATGSTMYYRLSDGSQWLTTSGTITIDSGYSHSADNEEEQFTIQLKCILNGEESDVNDVTITVTPKVASGSISAVRRPNNNDYATEATITLNPSPTTGATSTYNIDNGSPIELTETVTIDVNETQAAGKYKINATKEDYVNADAVSSPQVTLNRKKFYYGMGDVTLANEAAIKSLAGGGSLEQSTMAGTYNINVTSETVGKYAWFCGTGTLTSVTSGGFAVPMEAVVVVDGYNCYRTSSPIQETGSNTFNVQ